MPPRQDLMHANLKSIHGNRCFWTMFDNIFKFLGIRYQLAFVKISQAAEFLGGQAGFARRRLDYDALRLSTCLCMDFAVGYSDSLKYWSRILLFRKNHDVSSMMRIFMFT